MGSLSKISRRALVKCGLVSAGLPVVAKLLSSASTARAQTPAKNDQSFAAVPGQVGGQDVFGAYEVDPNWPKPLSSLPGNENWTWGSAESVFAENPDRVFILQRGELPNIKRPKEIDLPQLGPSLGFPIGRLPWRDATSASPPGPLDGPNRGTENVDWRWNHCLVSVNSKGDIVETWPEWDKMLRRPHAIYISPYDKDKYVWLVDDYRHAIFKFTHDVKKLVLTLGVPNEHGNDDKHFYRPTYLAWLPDGTMFVADGYANTRVVKFDKDGKYITAWGQKGTPPNETRPGYFNSVHGVAVDVQTGRVFVNDRNNHRIQVFDENGKFLNQWRVGDPPSDVHIIIMSADRHLWAYDRGTSKMIKYDLEGRFLYTWGTWGDFPGGFWGVHGMHVDQEGNFYVAEVDNGRAQKFIPRKGANPAMLVGPGVKPVWS
jgi:peptidylamidoglycolate lyase